MQWKLSAKNTISKVIFSSPIALFLGVGVLVATDILQPSYFKNLPVYYLCLPLVFSLFYFLKIVDVEKNVKEIIDETTLFKNFDELERSKPDF